jgi:flagellar M-ring protein FliF
MADNPILNRVSGFAAQPVTRQMALLIGMAASVALGVGVIQWAMKPDFQPLYGAMSPADNATAVSQRHSLHHGRGLGLTERSQR